ncbi:MAG: replication-associated recombination protein A [Coriobacteriales bacterium]|jgi:putative ATPase|nr:replication-associated recombination protein A [Coriobacteriales bacterium]
MAGLFDAQEEAAILVNAPLAVRMRPQTLDDFVGQDQVVGSGSWLRQAIERDQLSSVLFFGPAGTGKTTLAMIIAKLSHAHFAQVSAIGGSVADLRKAIQEARQRLLDQGKRTILFVDEIHRFNRAQQDALLHAVEDQVVILIGATTENPYFEVNSALISRTRVLQFKPLEDSDIAEIIGRACRDHGWTLDAKALELLCAKAAGDARFALTSLEAAAQVRQTKAIRAADIQNASPAGKTSYDKQGDAHYDVISAFIKSMRGSDPDAAVYYLARMLEGGEDPKFIARRIYIFASEDIGNADPQALLVAAAAFKAVEVIGLPECRINLAQACTYMALAPKSNAAVAAIDKAEQIASQQPGLAVPDHLRDRHRPGSEDYGRYVYPHGDPRGYVDQQYLPDGLKRGQIYQAGERGWEAYRHEQRRRDQN